MKRWLMIWALLLGLYVSAQAEPYIYSSDQTPLVYFDCEDFDAEIPAQLSGVFDGLLEENDSILSGALCMTKYHSQPENVLSADALLALEREGKVLLLGASFREGTWRCALETDSFFAPGQHFDVTILPRHGVDGNMVGALPALVCGGEAFIVSIFADARVFIQEYRADCADGSELRIGVGSGIVYASRMLDGIEQESGRAEGVFGSRLRGWTYDAFPKTCKQVNALDGAGMPAFEEGEALIFGVNVREQPTGKSPSLGQYTAIVRILDRTEGTHALWYRVQWADKTGWVSGDYVLFPEHEPHRSQIAQQLSQALDE